MKIGIQFFHPISFNPSVLFLLESIAYYTGCLLFLDYHSKISKLIDFVGNPPDRLISLKRKFIPSNLSAYQSCAAIDIYIYKANAKGMKGIESGNMVTPRFISSFRLKA